MATIREIKTGEDEATVLAELDNQSQATTDEDYDVSDDEYDDEEDEDDFEDEFYAPFKSSVGKITVESNVTLGSATHVSGSTVVGAAGIRIPFCHDDDESVDSECGHCTCDKHKKILSFMDACVKLGFQLLSSDFEKSFKPLQNAFNSSQKCTPIKQLNGVALSVKRVCNYALEQSANGYIEKFKKFIQKEMMDSDFEHIEFLIEMHFEMKDNFDCYSKNFTLLLAIATQLKPAYGEAVGFRVSSKSFKESQAIDRFLKTQEDIRTALVHYEEVLKEIKEKFEEQHKTTLLMPHVSESVRSLMNGCLWIQFDPADSKFSHNELESSSENIDLSPFEFDILDNANQNRSSKHVQNSTKNKKSQSKNCSTETSIQTSISSTNEILKCDKAKKLKKKSARSKGDGSPLNTGGHDEAAGDCPRLGNTEKKNCSRANSGCGVRTLTVKERIVKAVCFTAANCERGFKLSSEHFESENSGKTSDGRKSCSNSWERHRDRSESSSCNRQGVNEKVAKPLDPKVVQQNVEAKLKRNSCLKRNFNCCLKRNFGKENTPELIAEVNYQKSVTTQNENVSKPSQKSQNQSSVDEENNVSEFEVKPSAKKQAQPPPGKMATYLMRPDDYLDDSDEIGMEDLSEFITVNNKRNAAAARKAANGSNKNGGGELIVNENAGNGGKRNDSFQSDDYGSLNGGGGNNGNGNNFDKSGKNRNSRFEKPGNVSGNGGVVNNIGNSVNNNISGNINNSSGPGSNNCSNVMMSNGFADSKTFATNNLTVTQKMQALMSSTDTKQSVSIGDAFVDTSKKTNDVIEPPDTFKMDSIVNSNSNKLDSFSAAFSSGDSFLCNGTITSKPKPISKPVATVDPCKNDNPSVVTTSAKNVDKWNSVSLFTPDTALTNGSSLNQPDAPVYQGYSPFNGSDRLRPVQDSMAKYTKGCGNGSKTDDFDNSSKEPITSKSSQMVFSAPFPNGSVYSGFFSNPPLGSAASRGSESAAFCSIAPPGFDIANDLLKYGSSEFRNNKATELSPELDVKSNLNPTASVFNPSLPAPGKDFFPSANPPGGVLFNRSNSTPESPFLTSGKSGVNSAGTVTGSSLLASTLASNLTNAVSRSCNKRVEEQSRIVSAPNIIPTSRASTCTGFVSRVELLRIYKEQMNLHLRLLAAEMSDSKSKVFFLNKLQEKHVLVLDDVETEALLQDLNARIIVVKELLDQVYCRYKHNIMLLNSCDVNYDQLARVDFHVPSLTSNLQRLFSISYFS